MSGKDRELAAIGSIIGLLTPLDEGERTRVLEYVLKRLEMATIRTPATNPRETLNTPTTSSAARAVTDIRSLTAEKQPRSANEMVALVAYYLSELGQKEQLESQNLTMKQQRFENTFFSLLDLFTNLVSSMEVSMPDHERGIGATQTFKGRECFTYFYSELKSILADEQTKNPDKGLSEQCIDAYAVFVSSKQTYVGHYFRTLYNGELHSP